MKLTEVSANKLQLFLMSYLIEHKETAYTSTELGHAAIKHFQVHQRYDVVSSKRFKSRLRSHLKKLVEAKIITRTITSSPLLKNKIYKYQYGK